MEVLVNRIYRHFKGDYYVVEAIAIDSETQMEVVVYRSLYGEGLLYVRSKAMFTSLVDTEKYPHIQQKYRFELQNINSIVLNR